MRVTYSTRQGKELPFGEDRFVLAGIQHLAIEQNSPVILFDRVGALLKQFGLRESGDTLARLRKGFGRLAGLSVSLQFGRTSKALDEDAHGEQLFVIERYSLPTRNGLRSEHAGQLAIPELHPYGVVLGDRFWRHLSEHSNHLLVPLDLLKLFIDRPTGWDYLCFLVARCGAARRSSKVPHEALMSLFRDTERQTDRDIIRALQRYHSEILRATGGRLNAELVEDGTFPSDGGRPKKRWALVVRPSRSLFERPATLIEG